jgi:hypothetical protein
LRELLLHASREVAGRNHYPGMTQDKEFTDLIQAGFP